jgi:site-specific DNA recombinase
MGHTYSTKNGNIQYRYYVCLRAQKRGWHTCPSKSIPAAEIERLVIEQIRAIGRDPGLLGATLKHSRKQAKDALAAMETERAALERDLKRHYREIRTLATEAGVSNGVGAARLGELNERIRTGEQAMTALRERAVALSREVVDEREVEDALAAFDPVWETLTPKEQARVVRLLVQQVDYDGSTGTVSLAFHPDGLKTLAAEVEEEVAV